MNSKTTDKKAQILLITLLVLMILSIIVVGIVNLVNQDVTQVSTREKYSQIYNTAESELKKIIDEYGDYDTQLTGLTSEVDYICLEQEAGKRYTCEPDSIDIDNEVYFSDLALSTEILVENSQNVNDYELKKDQSLELNLSGYDGQLQLSWDKRVALELTLTYFNDLNSNGVKDSNESYEIVKDIYDYEDIFSSSQADDPCTQNSSYHQFLFECGSFDENEKKTTSQFTLGNINGLQANSKTVSLRITARMEGDYDSVLLDVKHPLDTFPETYPEQIREFSAVSYDSEDELTPVVRIVTQIPLYPQTNTAFDYSFITEDSIP